MQLEDQWLTRDQAIAQRDVHRKASDEWLGRMVVAILAGNGAGLIALANSAVVSQSGLLTRLIALGVAGCFLAGVALSFLALASRRIHHIGQEWFYAKRTRQMDFDAHFVPHMDPKDVGELRGHMNADMAQTENAARFNGDAADKYLTRSMWASIFGVLLMIATLLFAPRHEVAMNRSVSMQSPAPAAAAPTLQSPKASEESAWRPAPSDHRAGQTSPASVAQ